MCDFSEDDIQVEIVLPEFYVEYNKATMSKFASAVSHYCKGAALAGQDVVEFTLQDITVLQTSSIEEVMARFGIVMAHEHGLTEGRRWTRFVADVKGLKELLSEGEEK